MVMGDLIGMGMQDCSKNLQSATAIEHQGKADHPHPDPPPSKGREKEIFPMPLAGDG
jgi:hypothetical protein